MARFARPTAWSLRRLIFSLIMAGYVGTAHAADISLLKGADGSQLVVVAGPIELGDDEKFAGVTSSIEGATVLLQSQGGSTIAALNIGTAIRLKLWRTFVPQGATCASACALIWLAGTDRSVGTAGRIGFHASYVVKAGVPLETGAGNALVGAYLNKLGLRDTAVIYVTSAAPESITWLTAVDARAIGIKAAFDTANVPLLETPTKQATVAPLAIPNFRKPESETSRPTMLSDNNMMGFLYSAYPGSITINNYNPCVKGSCLIGLKKSEKWIGEDGKSRQIVVGVVSVTNGSHAQGGTIGIGVFRWDYVTWVPEISIPAVMSLGGWGGYGGEIKILHITGMDPVIVAEDGGMHQGVIDESTSIIINVYGTFKDVLDMMSGHAMGGNCDETEPSCKEQIRTLDFKSSISVTAAVGSGMDVLQTFSSELPRPPKRWHIEANGRVLDMSKPTALSSQAASPSANRSFSSGLSDRQAYENWFDKLTGDTKDGATFWAEQRSLRNPASCLTAKPANAEWTAGCVSGKLHLLVPDANRKSDPDYKRGWNSL